MFFVILIGMAVVFISQADAGDDGDGNQDLASVCDAVFCSRISAEEVGYTGEDRVMTLSDIAVISIMRGDGLASDYVCGMMDRMYPWPGAYTMKMSYGDLQDACGDPAGECTQEVVRTYEVEYGGMLTVEMGLYA